MAKTKTPFLSLGAHGTVGRSVTAQKRGSITLLREKPLPTYHYTLPQAYQRWLYEDYAYLWRQQSVSTKQQYATTGTRYHLTGFQYWMKYHLTLLPDILAWWKLDANRGAICYDSSRNSRNGTITGPSPIDLRINGALSFDGINDRITFPVDLLSEADIQNYTLFFFYTPTRLTALSQVIFSSEGRWNIAQQATTHRLRLWHWDTAGREVLSNSAVVADQTYAVTCTFDGTNMRMYLDKTLQAMITASAVPTIDANHIITVLGTRFDLGGSYFTKCYIDNFIIFNRTLDQNEIDRWSDRRYPP